MHTILALHHIIIIIKVVILENFYDRSNGKTCETNCCHTTNLQKDTRNYCYITLKIPSYIESILLTMPIRIQFLFLFF
jgi:hypothetical protein